MYRVTLCAKLINLLTEKKYSGRDIVPFTADESSAQSAIADFLVNGDHSWDPITIISFSM